MSNTNATTPLIQPSQNDVNGGVTNDGKRALEKYVRELFKAVNGISYFISGNALPTSAADRNLIVPAGSGYISGYYVTWAQTTVALPASVTSHIFVKLVFSSGLASNVQIEDNTSGTHPADAIKYGTVVTSGSAITASTDQRLLDGNQRLRRAVISATGTTNWIVPANVTKLRLRQWGAGGGGGGGGGSDGTATAGNGIHGGPGGYVEAVVTVTPGGTVTIVNGSGGAGGGGGSSGGGNGSNGSAGGGSSLTVSGVFVSAADGGAGGFAGAGASGGSPGADAAFQRNNFGDAAVSLGTADLLGRGTGRGGGYGGNGASTNASGSAGSAGQNAVTILDY